MTNDDLDAMAKELGLHIDDGKINNSDDDVVVSDDDSDNDNPISPKAAPALLAPSAPPPLSRPPSTIMSTTSFMGQIARTESSMIGQSSVQPRNFEGWLKKEGGRRKTLKKRWFVLNASSNTLFYHVKPGDACLGCVPLMDVNVLSLGQKKHGFALELFSVLGGAIKSSKMAEGKMVAGAHESFVMYAESENERDLWVRALNSASTNREKVVTEVKEKEAEKQARFKDLKIMTEVYAGIDALGHGVVPRPNFIQWLQLCGVSESVSRAMGKVLDYDNTMLIEFEAFIHAWRKQALPLSETDGYRCDTVMHELISPIVEIGAHKSDKGSPFCYVKNFQEYLFTKFKMPLEISGELAVPLQNKDKLSSILFVRGILRGLIPSTQDEAHTVTQAIRDFMSFDTEGQRQHHIPRHDFARRMNDHVKPSLSRTLCLLIFDIVTLRSGGKLTLTEFVEAVRVGLVPLSSNNDSSMLSSKLLELQRTFQALSDNQSTMNLDVLYKSLRQHLTKPQARVICTATDVAASRAIDLAEFCRLVFFGLVESVPMPLPKGPPELTSSVSTLSIDPSSRASHISSSSVGAGGGGSTLSLAAIGSSSSNSIGFGGGLVSSTSTFSVTPQQKSNQLELTAEVVETMPMLLSGELNAVQVMVDSTGKRVSLLYSGQVELGEVWKNVRLNTNSYIVLTIPTPPDLESPSFVFLTVLSPDSEPKEKMLYVLMRRAITNRLQASGVSVLKQVDVKNPQLDLLPSNLATLIQIV
eukprot:c6359_g1_i1.p1 GENE.c6359_g1_i1~~c6359_g1_i1.p1  ORF type:complete len:808 (+),score=214.08 c6359_g1_i1:163-2424(+)